MNFPSFSIVVPTYQRRDVVCDAVRAICTIQYRGPVELICIIDGSTDGSEQALAAIDCPFPTKIIHQENAGPAAARNRGAAEASGDILLFLDDDMMCRPDILEQHARSHDEGAHAVLGHIPLDSSSPDGFLAAAVGRWAADRARKLAAGAPITLFDLVSGHMSVRRSLFEALGGFDPAFTSNGSYGDEDLDLGIRLVEAGKVVFNPEAIASQRYVVAPAEYLRQWKDAGRADVRFARKHPNRSKELFAEHGSERLLTRLLLRPIARSVRLSNAARSAALRLAAHEKNVSPLLRRVVANLFRHARDVAYWRGVNEAGGIPAKSRALILCYHSISDLSGDKILSEYGIAPTNFEKQLDELIARGFTFISPDELMALLGGGRLPRKPVLLTFDDCYEELVEVARSILRPRGITAIAFAVTGMASGTNEWDQAIGARELRLLDSDGLAELRRNGVEIGCHSRSHRPLRTLDEPALRSETADAADDLAALGLPRPRFFAYPHGMHDRHARDAARSAGFVAAFGLLSRHADPVSDRYALPRVEILARDSGWRLRLKLIAPALAPLTRLRSVLRRVASSVAGRLRRPGPLRVRSATLR